MQDEVLRPILITDEEGQPDYQSDSGIMIRPNWPRPKVKGQGVVKDKDGNIKHKFTIKED